MRSKFNSNFSNYALTLLLQTLLVFAGCAKSSDEKKDSSPGGNQGVSLPGGTNVISANNLKGTWTVESASCNGEDVSSSYIPSGTQIAYDFDGSNWAQITYSSSSSCTQTLTLPYTFDSSGLKVAAGVSALVQCSSSGCSIPGNFSGSLCGSNFSMSQPISMAITSFQDNVAKTNQTDAVSTSKCQSYGKNGPLVLTMNKL